MSRYSPTMIDIIKCIWAHNFYASRREKENIQSLFYSYFDSVIDKNICMEFVNKIEEHIDMLSVCFITLKRVRVRRLQWHSRDFVEIYAWNLCYVTLNLRFTLSIQTLIQPIADCIIRCIGVQGMMFSSAQAVYLCGISIKYSKWRQIRRAKVAYSGNENSTRYIRLPRQSKASSIFKWLCY